MDYEPTGLPGAATAVLSPASLSGRLLYVEDNSRIAEMTELMLEDIGLDVTWVDCAEGALIQLDSAIDRFDLVFTDVVMPGMSGIDLAKRIVHHWPDLPVVLTSGFSRDLAEGFGSEFELLPKPFRRSELIECLNRHLRREKD